MNVGILASAKRGQQKPAARSSRFHPNAQYAGRISGRGIFNANVQNTTNQKVLDLQVENSVYF